MKKQIILNFNYNENYDQNNFLESESNKVALSWINKFPDWNNQKISIIYGPNGCGKTHLSKIWQKKSTAIILNKNSNLEDILKKFSTGENILIDDYETLDLNDNFLYNLYNISKEHNSGYALITSAKRPIEWNIQLADTKSRILSLNAIAINDPDDTLLSGILIKLFTDRQLKVSPEVINYILLRTERTCKSLICLVEKIDKLSLEKKRNITIPLIKDIL